MDNERAEAYLTYIEKFCRDPRMAGDIVRLMKKNNIDEHDADFLKLFVFDADGAIKFVSIGSHEIDMACRIWNMHHDRDVTFVAVHFLEDMLENGIKNANAIYDSLMGDILVRHTPTDIFPKNLSQLHRMYFSDHGYRYVHFTLSGSTSMFSLYSLYGMMYRSFSEKYVSYIRTIGYDTVISVFNYTMSYFTKTGLTRKRMLQLLYDAHDDEKMTAWLLQLFNTIEKCCGRLTTGRITAKWIKENYGLPLDFIAESDLTEASAYDSELIALLAHVFTATNPQSPHVCPSDRFCNMHSQKTYKKLREMLSVDMRANRGVYSNKTLRMMLDTIHMLDDDRILGLFPWLISYPPYPLQDARHGDIGDVIALSTYPFDGGHTFLGDVGELHALLATHDVNVLYRFVLWVQYQFVLRNLCYHLQMKQDVSGASFNYDVNTFPVGWRKYVYSGSLDAISYDDIFSIGYYHYPDRYDGVDDAAEATLRREANARLGRAFDRITKNLQNMPSYDAMKSAVASQGAPPDEYIYELLAK